MPSWKDLDKFLRNDKWTHLPQNSGTDKTYVKYLPDGEILRTRVSRSSAEIGKGLFASILKNQLHVSKEYFNKVLSSGKHSSDDPRLRKQ
ncbi:MAG: hypothetical protein LBC58_05615 [Clostridiales Family XIII bacterium]|jgi:hypothetical protein|nr:hypothetical protein [Clostridiales Family XIII bacterium]